MLALSARRHHMNWGVWNVILHNRRDEGGSHLKRDKEKQNKPAVVIFGLTQFILWKISREEHEGWLLRDGCSIPDGINSEKLCVV